MKQLTCPINGTRNIAEFQYLGPVRVPLGDDPGTLIQHLFYADNTIGVVREWWRHTPSNTVFLAERHTATDAIVKTWLPSQPIPGGD